MDNILVQIWNFLWDYQLWLVFMVAFVLWIIIRGYDLGKWIIKKANKPVEQQDQDPESRDL